MLLSVCNAQVLTRNDQLILKNARANSPTTGKGKGKGKRSKKGKKGKGGASHSQPSRAGGVSKKRAILADHKKPGKKACSQDWSCEWSQDYTGWGQGCSEDWGSWGQDWGQGEDWGQWGQDWGQDWEYSGDWGESWGCDKAKEGPGTGKADAKKKKKPKTGPAKPESSESFEYPNSFARRPCPRSHASALWKAIVRTFSSEVLPSVGEHTRSKNEAGE